MIYNYKGITIRDQLKPGDFGYLLYLHGVLYAKEYGFDTTFEGYVAQTIAEVAKSPDLNGSCLWVAEKNGLIIGTISIVRRSPLAAQLRWFLVEPEFRGMGLGKHLVGLALNFCKLQGYSKVNLWTLSHLAAATNIYLSYGFVAAEEKTHLLWGQRITEISYELNLN